MATNLIAENADGVSAGGENCSESGAPALTQGAAIAAGAVYAEPDGIAYTTAAQDVLEEWFEEIGIDLDADDAKRLFDKMTAASHGQAPAGAAPHPACKSDTLVNGGALKLALNALRRAGKNEIADELEITAQAAPAAGAVAEPTDDEILNRTGSPYAPGTREYDLELIRWYRERTAIAPTPSPQAAQQAPAGATSDWDMRGRLAASLACWHRLTPVEAEELVALAQRVWTPHATPQAELDELRRAFAPQTVEQVWTASQSLAYPSKAAQIINAARALLAAPAAPSTPASGGATTQVVGVVDASEKPRLRVWGWVWKNKVHEDGCHYVPSYTPAQHVPRGELLAIVDPADLHAPLENTQWHDPGKAALAADWSHCSVAEAIGNALAKKNQLTFQGENRD